VVVLLRALLGASAIPTEPGVPATIQLHDTWPPGRSRSSKQSVPLCWVQSQEEDGEGMEDAAELLGALQHVAVPGAYTLFATDPAKVRVLLFSPYQCVSNPVSHPQMLDASTAAGTQTGRLCRRTAMWSLPPDFSAESNGRERCSSRSALSLTVDLSVRQGGRLLSGDDDEDEDGFGPEAAAEDTGAAQPLPVRRRIAALQQNQVWRGAHEFIARSQL